MLRKSLSYLGVSVGAATACGLAYRAPTNPPLVRTLATSRDIYTFRKEYSKKPLLESELPSSPIALFDTWLDDAIVAKVNEPNAMCLSTCADGQPSARFVLLKEVDTRGFVWCTNYGSRKSTELSTNPNAALSFWWGELERQVRVEGRVEKISAEQSDLYFTFRPRGSKIGAMVSEQSKPVLERQELEDRDKRLNAEHAPKDVIPRPEGWGGFRLIPSRIEFWKGRENRIHDRICYVREGTAAYETLRRECLEKYGEQGEKLLASRLQDGWTYMRLQP